MRGPSILRQVRRITRFCPYRGQFRNSAAFAHDGWTIIERIGQRRLHGWLPSDRSRRPRTIPRGHSCASAQSGGCGCLFHPCVSRNCDGLWRFVVGVRFPDRRRSVHHSAVSSRIVRVAGRRLLLPDVFHLLRVDRRAPVLYLRGFAHDENPNTVGEVAEIFNVVWMPWPRWAFRSLKTLLTLEARLTPALWEVGPVIAVSRPGEMLNLPTACRFKLDDSAWKSVVADLSARGSGRDRGAAEVTARFPGSLQLSARGHSVSSRHRR